MIKETIKPSHILWRDTLYYWTMQNLGIDNKTKENLEKRGLPAEVAFEKYGIRSFDKNKLEQGFYNALKKLSSIDGAYFSELDGKKKVSIPGFYKENNKILCAENKNSYLIPIINEYGFISGYQIRHLNGKVRYTFFSSGDKEGGCPFSGCENIHHVGFEITEDKKAPKTINLTEGCLKADIAHYLSGKPYIAIMGITNQGQLKKELEVLKAKGTKTINLCFDMDYKTKKGVKMALENIKKIIKKCKLDYRIIDWDDKYKGIDDYLLSLKGKKYAN